VANGKTVDVEGYLRLPERISVTDRVVIDLFSRRGGEGDRASVEFVLGTGPNQLERPEADFTVTSLRARTRRGKVVTLNDRVAVTGKVSLAAETCLVRVVEVRIVAA
jgi:hypothetical protein